MHCNARLSRFSKELLIKRYLDGEKVSKLSKQFGVSRKCCYEWINRYEVQGKAGLEQRRSGPKVSPRRISSKKESKILAVRTKYNEGPDRIAFRVGIPRSTVYQVLKRNGKNRLFEKKGKIHTKRYEKNSPGERLQVDFKQLPAIAGKKYRYQVTIIDDYSRYVFAQIIEKRTTKAVTSVILKFLDQFPFKVKEVATDNGWEFTLRFTYNKSRKTYFQKELEKLGIKHTLIKPRSPELNGKVERFHRTIDEELYLIKHFKNEEHRKKELERYLKRYNSKRIHLGIRGMTPQQKLDIFLEEKCYQVS